MSSSFTCVCGAQIRKNLGEGHGLQLLVSEDFTNHRNAELSADEVYSELIHAAIVVAQCRSCGSISLINEEEGMISIFKPIAPTEGAL